MAVRYYLGPMIWVAPIPQEDGSIQWIDAARLPPLYAGRLCLCCPLFTTFRQRDGERITSLDVTDRIAIHRYEASAARLAIADEHPLLIALPQNKDGRWSDAALTALDRVGISRAAARTSTREIAQLMISHQAGRAHDDARRVRIVMGGEDL